MEFNTLEDVPDKLRRLQKTEWLLYSASCKSINDDGGIAVDPREKGRLIAIYKKAYYAYTQMSCVECREHKIIQLEIELGKLLEELEKKYGV